MMNILSTDPPTPSQSSHSTQVTSSPPPETTISHKLLKATPLTEVKSNISTHYYKEAQARQAEIPNTDVLFKKMKKAIKQYDIDGFLVAYLSQIHHNSALQVPLSSVADNIQTQWETILTTQFNVIPDQPFLEELCAKWFYIVNQKGLPSTQDKLEDILYFIAGKYKGPPQKKPTSKKANHPLTRFFKK